MVLKLYGAPLSTCTRRVGLYLHEKKVPFEFKAIDLAKNEQKSPEYTSMQPFGQVPVLDDDGFLVYESRAIIRYLEAKYDQKPPHLVPSVFDIKAYAIFEQGASIELTNFEPLASKVYMEKIVKPRSGGKPDEDVVKAVITQLEGKLDGYEAILSKQRYIGGNQYTLADLFHLPYGDGLSVAKYGILLDEQKRPNIARWWKDISGREAWAQVKGGVETKTSY